MLIKLSKYYIYLLQGYDVLTYVTDKVTSSSDWYEKDSTVHVVVSLDEEFWQRYLTFDCVGFKIAPEHSKRILERVSGNNFWYH